MRRLRTTRIRTRRCSRRIGIHPSRSRILNHSRSRTLIRIPRLPRAIHSIRPLPKSIHRRHSPIIHRRRQSKIRRIHHPMIRTGMDTRTGMGTGMETGVRTRGIIRAILSTRVGMGRRGMLRSIHHLRRSRRFRKRRLILSSRTLIPGTSRNRSLRREPTAHSFSLTGNRRRVRVGVRLRRSVSVGSKGMARSEWGLPRT